MGVKTADGEEAIAVVPPCTRKGVAVSVSTSVVPPTSTEHRNAVGNVAVFSDTECDGWNVIRNDCIVGSFHKRSCK